MDEKLAVQPMALPDTVPIRQSQVKAEFGKGNNLLDYLGEGGVTSSPPLKLTDFLGTSSAPEIPSANHAYQGRVIWNYGTASSEPGNYYTETGSAVPIDTQVGDMHMMFGGHAGGFTYNRIQGFDLGSQVLSRVVGYYTELTSPQFKLSCSMNFVESEGAGSTQTHSMTCRSDPSYPAADFMAYAIRVPKANLPFSAGDNLKWALNNTGTGYVNIIGLIPNSIVMFLGAAGQTMDGDAPDVGEVMFKTGGTSKNKRWRVKGGYGYGQADSNGNFVFDMRNGGAGLIAASVLVGVQA